MSHGAADGRREASSLCRAHATEEMLSVYHEAGLNPLLCLQISTALSRAGNVLSVAEWPLSLLRRATVPLMDAENFDARWLISSALLAPPAAMLYLRAWHALPWAALAGCCAAAAAAWALRGHKVRPA